MAKPIIVSGMQPTGKIHLGNYLGALNNWLSIQKSDKYESIFFIADYHSITENYSAEEKRQQVFDLACTYLAIGLNTEKSIIFVQSAVPECTELTWIFNTLTPIAELQRMTQFKDKSERQEKNINMGLFDYPVLQAADILLYDGSLVPVGEDQIQHVELTRDAARWFNNKYKANYFPEAKPLLTSCPRLMSLLEPAKKMSKSLGEKHCLNIDEEPEEIAKKLAKAVTTPEGVANLKLIYDTFKEQMTGDFDENKMGETKKIIAEGLAKHFADFRKRKKELLSQPEEVAKILEAGRARASVIAQKRIVEIKKIIGVI